ncbi:hypothetical protein OBBRIDRAFT_535932 [Obba rivulosa]|uniref:Secreted protein n=1 Tax=Obba rivulosa TaxID=1052685 RepID=A0A8E2DTF6_9APHY|nr:hypothetical protein OBBRIDRAFT_535932 [Obba rivulosa]
MTRRWRWILYLIRIYSRRLCYVHDLVPALVHHACPSATKAKQLRVALSDALVTRHGSVTVRARAATLFSPSLVLLWSTLIVFCRSKSSTPFVTNAALHPCCYGTAKRTQSFDVCTMSLR